MSKFNNFILIIVFLLAERLERRTAFAAGGTTGFKDCARCATSDMRSDCLTFSLLPPSDFDDQCLVGKLGRRSAFCAQLAESKEDVLLVLLFEIEDFKSFAGICEGLGATLRLFRTKPFLSLTVSCPSFAATVTITSHT